MSINHPFVAALLAQADAPGFLHLSSGRAGAIVAALTGLVSVVIGGLALARSLRRSGDARRGAALALIAGPIGIAVGAVTAAASDGGIGTGNGLAGAVVAMLVGVTGTVLGGLALARSRRNTLIDRA